MQPYSLPEHLMRISPFRSFAALLSDWALIAASFACAIAYPYPAVYIAAAIAIARTQLALAVMMHESAHGVLAESQKINDFVGQVFAAAPLMLSLFAYRKGHMKHHRAPMANDDPVAVVFGIGDYPITKKQLAWRLLKDLTSISYFLSMRDFIVGKHHNLSADEISKPCARIFVLFSILASNGALFGVLAMLQHPWMYLGLWILPALTFLQVFARIRAITEHAGYPPGDDQIRNARTIVCRNWQTFFVGPHCIHYHIEHHLHVRAPFYRLPAIHQIMKAHGVLPAENLYRGYGKVLMDVTI